MRALDLDSLARSLVVDAGVSPAAVLGAAGRTTEGWRVATGAAGVRSVTHPEAVAPDTPFDLASLTKPVVATALARLVRHGHLSWETPVGVVVPELSQTASGDLPLVLFVSHRAGLDAHHAIYSPLVSGKSVDLAAALATAGNARRPECAGRPPAEGFAPLYSDLGFMIAGLVASRAAGQDLASVVATEVAGPLGLDLTSAAKWRDRQPDFQEKVAPTEVVPWRGGELFGAVHDENAWALAGLGLAGHAGLFGTVNGVTGFGMAVLDALAGRLPDWLLPEEAEVLVRPRPRGTLRAGFDGRSNEGSSAGELFGARAFGHLGFTGTSLWCDPDASVVAVVLTNRVNPTRENVAIRAARPHLHGALYRAAVGLVHKDGP